MSDVKATDLHAGSPVPHQTPRANLSRQHRVVRNSWGSLSSQRADAMSSEPATQEKCTGPIPTRNGFLVTESGRLSSPWAMTSLPIACEDGDWPAITELGNDE
jgi:hypothetical protein